MSTPTTTASELRAEETQLEIGTIGGPTAASWREQALTRIAEYEDLAEAFRYPGTRDPRVVVSERIHRHLRTAREAAEGRWEPPARKPKVKPRRWARFKAMVGGSPLERTASNLDAAEADLLRLAPDSFLEGQLPSLISHVRKHLATGDVRRLAMEALWTQRQDLLRRNPSAALPELRQHERDVIISAVRGASSEARREIVRLRSFRNILYVAATVLTLACVGLVVLGAAKPSLLPLCFQPSQDLAVCPTGDEAIAATGGGGAQSVGDADAVIRGIASPWDLPLIALMGVVAAAVSAAVALRNLWGTTTPYALPVALAVLKLPTGALTAVLGLMLMRGEFVPGLTALDTPAQILSWAIVFGYAQQLFTRLIDERVHRVLNQVGGRERRQGPQPLTDALAPTRPVDSNGGGANGSGPSNGGTGGGAGGGGTGATAAAVTSGDPAIGVASVHNKGQGPEPPAAPSGRAQGVPEPLAARPEATRGGPDRPGAVPARGDADPA